MNTKKSIKIVFLFSLLFLLLSGKEVLASGQMGMFRKSIIVQTENSSVAPIVVKENIKERVDFGIMDMKNGRTASFDNNGFEIILNTGSLLKPTGIEIVLFNEQMEFPWSLKKLSNVYQYDFDNDFAIDAEHPFSVKIKYEEKNNDFKQIFFYDTLQKVWKSLPSQDEPELMTVSAETKAPFLRLAIFSYPGVITKGQASWYAYKGGDFTASPDFPKGSILKVTNLENEKSLNVTVNDWGPERDKHPERVIDLDKIAFAKLADIGDGIINVKIDPIFVASDSRGRVLGIKIKGVGSQPEVAAKSAVVMTEDGKLLYNKNGQTAMPLASLSKLMAVWVFLDGKPGLYQQVEYKYADEQYNYQYCKPWESAKVALKEGDIVLIKDLIYSALVGSANNAVETLARVSGLPRQEFVKKMNEQAKAWGAKTTNFIEPTGLSTSNVSSAEDYAIIMRGVLANQTISQASITQKYVFSTLNTKKEHTLKNTDKMLADRPEIIGSKTGYLHEAGHCLAVKIKNGEKNLYLAILNSSSRDTSYQEMGDLISYATNKF